MLRRTSVENVKNGVVIRRPNENYLVVTMQIYPRFLAKAKVDEFQRCLSPEPKLFAEYRDLCKRHSNHETAFQLVNYEGRFDLGAEGKENLARLAKLAKSCEVYLICRCRPDEHCHVDLMLLMARHLHAAPIQDLPFEYERFRARL